MASHQWSWQGSAVVYSLGTAGWESLYPGNLCLDKVGWPCPPVLPSTTRRDHTFEWLLTCLCELLQGKPKPEVIWTKGDQPLDTNHINIRTTERDTIFYIRNAQRKDSGKYELTVRINGAEDKATLDIRVIGKAGDGTCHSGSHPCFLVGGSSCSGWDGKRPAIRQGTVGFLFQWDLLQDHGDEVLRVSAQPMPIAASHPSSAAMGEKRLKARCEEWSRHRMWGKQNRIPPCEGLCLQSHRVPPRT